MFVTKIFHLQEKWQGPSLVPRPSPAPVFDRLQWLSFCILQAIKNRSRGRPGNEATKDHRSAVGPEYGGIHYGHSVYFR